MNKKKEFQEKINNLNTLIYDYCVAKRANLTNPYIDISNKIILTLSIFSILLTFILLDKLPFESNLELNIFISSFSLFYPISIYLERETSFFKYIMNHSASNKVIRYYYDYFNITDDEITIKNNRVLFNYVVDWVFSSLAFPFMSALLLTISALSFLASGGIKYKILSLIVLILFYGLLHVYIKNYIKKRKERISLLIPEEKMIEMKKEVSIKLKELKGNKEKNDEIRESLELKKKINEINLNYSFVDNLIEDELSLYLKNNKMQSLEDYILNTEVKNINMTNE